MLDVALRAPRCNSEDQPEQGARDGRGEDRVMLRKIDPQRRDRCGRGSVT